MTAELPPGTILLDKYRVDRVLGKGGMGVVLAATHLQLNERVAMKFLLPEVLSNREIVTRFMREAQAAVRLKGEHVARVIDVGTLPWGAPYMVMEFLEGLDLAELIARRGLLPTHEIADYLLQACEALAEAHSLGIIHRDIKPANFFITKRPDGSPLLKVLDFGISKAPVPHEGGLTGTQAVMGTPSYMSPEQMRSVRDVDARTDIWALGVVLYEALSGQRPFEADTFSALCLKVAMDPTPPLAVRVPPGLDTVVCRCLEKDRTRRFASVAELAVALAPYAGNMRQASTVVERASAILGLVVPRRASTIAEDCSPSPVVQATSRAQHLAAAAPTTLRASAGSRISDDPSTRRGFWIGSAIVAVAGAVAAVALVTRDAGSSNGADRTEGRQTADRAVDPAEPVAGSAAASSVQPTKEASTEPPANKAVENAPPPEQHALTPSIDAGVTPIEESVANPDAGPRPEEPSRTRRSRHSRSDAERSKVPNNKVIKQRSSPPDKDLDLDIRR